MNQSVQRRVCERCGTDKVRDLEAHHIQERRTATKGRLADGSNMNDLRNLVVLCSKCHDDYHAGTVEVL